MTISQNPSFDTFQGLFNEAEFVYRHLGSMLWIGLSIQMGIDKSCSIGVE